MGDPREESIQIKLLGQLLSDHLLPHLLCVLRLFACQHVGLGLEDLAIDGPVGEGSLPDNRLALPEVEIDESLPVLVVLDLELDVDIAHIRIVVALLHVIQGLAASAASSNQTAPILLDVLGMALCLPSD